MSEYGVKIKNYQAASVYEYQYGFRDSLDSENAMLTNSLFKDYLDTHGLKCKKDSTRDIICLEFGYGTKSYDELKKRYEDIKFRTENNKTVSKMDDFLSNLEKNKDKAKKINKDNLRILFYTEGVEIKYKTYNKQAEVIAEETIHYKMLYRTPGKAKKGTIMFIRDELYDKAHEYLYMGYQMPEQNSPIVEIGAYASLITSSIVGKVRILPNEILAVKDFKTSTWSNVVKVYSDEKQICHAESLDNYEITGEAFDGQALIDSSIFPSWADGYVLLRNHMTKCAAFSTNIQQFMKDQFGADYETATVTDMFGRTLNVKDIKLITTDNAFKWLKFKISFDYWSEWTSRNDYVWGIVKTSHPSKLDDVQRMSYQMINSLDIDSMENVCKVSIDYINKLKSDNDVFLDYLRKSATFANDFDVLVALVEHNPEFIHSDYFRKRKQDIIGAYVVNFKSGKVIQNADNLTIVGSPYALLLHSIGKSPLDDPTFQIEDGCIQCYTGRFETDEYLAEFRNPFNSRNNLGYLHNIQHEYFDKYFNLGSLCIAVNTVNTDWQARNNGADQDSDSCYTTNQPDIVAHAKYCYREYPTIVNEIKPEKNIYSYSLENYAKIDNTLMAAQMAIGQSSNLAQLALTYTYNFPKGSVEYKKYYDYVCILAVLAQVAIDNAKRKYAVDLNTEISRINKDMEVDKMGLPLFWVITKKDKRKARTDKQRTERQARNKQKILKNTNRDLVCPMNYLYNIKFVRKSDRTKVLPMEYFFIKHDIKNDRRNSKRVEDLIEKYSTEFHEYVLQYYDNWQEGDRDIVLQNNFDELIKDIQKINISRNYQGMMSWLINRAFKIGSGVRGKQEIIDCNTTKNKVLLLKTLFTVNKQCFLNCFKKCTTNNNCISK